MPLLFYAYCCWFVLNSEHAAFFYMGSFLGFIKSSEAGQKTHQNGPVISNVTPPSAFPLVPRCELKYKRAPSGLNAGPVISERS